MTSHKQSTTNQNHLITQSLGLCPLLAVSTTFTYALGLGIATLVIMLLSSLSLCKIIPHLVEPLRIPTSITLISFWTTITAMLIEAYAYELSKTIGLFVQIIVTNCAILHHISRISPLGSLKISLKESLQKGSEFLVILLLLGSIREILGAGTILSNIQQLLPAFDFLNITIPIIPQAYTIKVLSTPAGAFITLGLLIIFYRLYSQKHLSKPKPDHQIPITLR